MLDYRSFAKRFIVAAGLAAAVVGATALGGPAAGAQPTPPTVVHAAPVVLPVISPLQVQTFGHEATVAFTTTVPTAVTVEYKAAHAQIASRAPGIIADRQFRAERSYASTHTLKLTGLTSNTAYDVSVVAETQSGQKLTAQARVLTAKQRVRVTLREINITEDGDWWWMDGEPAWVVKLDWTGGAVAGCYPNTDVGFGGVCQHDSRGEGRFAPRNNRGDSLTWIFAEENFDAMPTRFHVNATADEEDWVPGVANVAGWLEDCVTALMCGNGFSPSLGGDWQVPQGKEVDTTVVRIPANDDGTDFHSELTFTFELFYDNLSYSSQRNAPSSTWRAPFGR